MGIAGALLACGEIVASGLGSSTGTWQGPEHRAIVRLSSLVEDAAARFETLDGDEPPGRLVLECNAALEACLALLRDMGDGDDLVVTTRDDLRRLGRLLRLVDGADVSFVMRQVRRVLGRFDARGTNLLRERRDPAR